MTDIELLSKRARKKAARAEAGFFDRPSTLSIKDSIDHTRLSPAYTPREITAHCEEALKFGFASVCIPLTSVPEARRVLNGSKVKVGTVAAFPLGATPLPIKISEILWAIDHGADEVDAVIDIPSVIAGDKKTVLEELNAFREAAPCSIIKVILEMPLLTDTQIITSLRLAEQAGIDYVKTCTGFNGSVTFYHVALLRTAASDSMKIKAAGGVRTYASAEILKALGADRIGTSKAVDFIKA